ncbi:hypothetical protein [Burkholderia cepacia]|uniref:hypothetical protein n=1 Tax=Burkholderia cepacia TaxID=292 RepID=UPI000ADE9BD1|nr:hypothetical protein [Burkholderia cepacia]
MPFANAPKLFDNTAPVGTRDRSIAPFGTHLDIDRPARLERRQDAPWYRVRRSFGR